ncbi:MAG: hypothetical protein IH800_09520 [Myxococcales bacterium]|nr:hypothetical protein [Myxococcales bacterium]
MPIRDNTNEISFSLGDLKRILRRRMGWFLAPTLIGIVGALVLALGLEPSYEAASIVLVEPQGIPDTLVKTTVVAKTESRYGQLKLQILARDNLSAIIDEFQLYPGESVPRAQLVEQLREAVSIEPLPPAIIDPRKPPTLESFRIAFRSNNPRIVADVTNRLTRDFIAAHLADRELQAKGASEFIENELAKSRGELQRVRQQITAFKEEHHGELPEQLSMNTQHLERLRNSLMTMSTSLSAAQGQIVAIREQMEQAKLSGSMSDTDPTKRKQLLEIALNGFRAQGKTERHPDVIQATAEIAALERLIERKAAAGEGISPVVRALQRELRNNKVTADVVQGEFTRLKAEIADYETRIERTPKRAADLGWLEATGKNMSDAIRELQLKLMDAKMGHTIELAQKGERFRVVEWAVRPDSPISPNRPLWFVVGSTLGLLAGLACLVLRETMDESFHSVVELQRVVTLPVLAAVPEIRLPSELASRRVRRRRLGISSAVILLLIVGGTLAFYLYGRSNGITTAQVFPGVAVDQRADV